MTKKKAKASRPIRAKAATAKTSVTKRSAAPADNGAATLIVLGYDDQQKPRGARFVDAKPDLVTKAADADGVQGLSSQSPKTWPRSPRNCPWVGFTPTAVGSCRTSGKTSTATSLWSLALEPRRSTEQENDKAVCPPPVACPGPGTRSRLAIS